MSALTATHVLAPLQGQETAVQLLTAILSRDRLNQAYLLAGPSGVGKRLAAQCLTKELVGENGILANHPDVLWVEPTYLESGEYIKASSASYSSQIPLIRIEQVREIIQFLAFPPLKTHKVVVIEAANSMQSAAAGALLKTLEEPPHYTTFIALAPSCETLLPTIVSRCQIIPFYRLSPQDMIQVLESGGHSEILEHPELLGMAWGCPGVAIAAWQHLKSIPDSLLKSVKSLPTKTRQALTIAREIDASLELKGQLWLVDYLQYHYWQSSRSFEISHILEQAKINLHKANVRLVWEVTLMQLADMN